jgi:hypothetical protein
MPALRLKPGVMPAFSFETNGGMMKKSVLLIACIAVLFLAGCGVPYHKRLDLVLASGNYEEAAELIESEKTKPKDHAYRENNMLLYHFDRAAVAQMRGLYADSSEELTKAGDLIDKLYTKSVTKELSAFIQNDMNLDYSGEDFEQVMVNIMRALNYMYLGDMHGAAIEARKVNHKLNVFADTYGDKAIYTDDAFARYISALAFEATGEFNDALIDYKKCVKAYAKYSVVYGTEFPKQPLSDLFRITAAMNYTDEMEKLQAEYGRVDYLPYKELKTKGEIIVVVYDGLPAYKVDRNGWPSYVQRGKNVMSVRIAAADGAETYAFVPQDLSAMAVKNLETRIGLIFAKKMVSGIVKEFAKQVPLLGIFVTPDRADTRSWRTIPSRFYLGRLPVKAGKSSVKVRVETAGSKGPVTEEYSFDVDLKPGMKKVIPVYMLK